MPVMAVTTSAIFLVLAFLSSLDLPGRVVTRVPQRCGRCFQRDRGGTRRTSWKFLRGGGKEKNANSAVGTPPKQELEIIPETAVAKDFEDLTAKLLMREKNDLVASKASQERRLMQPITEKELADLVSSESSASSSSAGQQSFAPSDVEEAVGWDRSARKTNRNNSTKRGRISASNHSASDEEGSYQEMCPLALADGSTDKFLHTPTMMVVTKDGDIVGRYDPRFNIAVDPTKPMPTVDEIMEDARRVEDGDIEDGLLHQYGSFHSPSHHQHALSYTKHDSSESSCSSTGGGGAVRRAQKKRALARNTAQKSKKRINRSAARHSHSRGDMENLLVPVVSSKKTSRKTRRKNSVPRASRDKRKFSER